jgi:hypothetical protein
MLLPLTRYGQRMEDDRYAAARAKIIARWQADPQGEAEKRLLGALPYYNTLLLRDTGVDIDVDALLASARTDYAAKERAVYEVDLSEATNLSEAINEVCRVVSGETVHNANASVLVLDALAVLRHAGCLLGPGLPREEPLVVVHNLAPGIAHSMFGRLRDEMWGIGLRWLVVGEPAGLDSYLTPPADSFFAEIVPIRPVLRDQGYDPDTRGWSLTPDTASGPSL